MAKGGFPKFVGGMTMGTMMNQMQKMQRELENTQKLLDEEEVSATSGGGAVEVTVNGKKEVLSIKLTPEVVDPDDIEMLQDLIITAINEANRKAQEKHDSEINKITGGINIPGL